MNEIAIAILGSGAFTIIVNALVELLKNLFGRKNDTEKAINFALLYALQMYGERLLQKKCVDAEEIKQFQEMFSLYKKRGGNGYADRLKTEVEALPCNWKIGV